MLMMIFISLLSLQVFAPSEKALYIVKPEASNYYEPLAKVVSWYESKDDILALNITEQAVGPFQIRQIRVNDYNRRRNTDYKIEDFFDYDLSKEMFFYYARGKSYEMAAKNWNGSGLLTIKYWNNVKKFL